MLNGDVQVLQNVLTRRQGFDEMVAYACWIQVHQTNPGQVFHLIEPAEQMGQAILDVEVTFIAGRVLGDQVELFYA